jgi:chaperonin GroES
MKILKDRVLVKPEEEITKIGSIFLPENIKTKGQSWKGTVIDKGLGLFKNGKYQSIPVNINDTIIYDTFAGKPIKINDVDYLLINEAEILGIITKD